MDTAAGATSRERSARSRRAALSRVQFAVATGPDRRRHRRKADPAQHRSQVPLADRVPPAALLRPSYRLQEIDRDLSLAFKAHMLRQSRELREAIEAGTDIRDRNGIRVKPLSPASMPMVTDGLVAVLDDAVEDGHIDSNPARGRRMRIKVPKPRRTFLELDELAALIGAASEQDISLGPGVAPIELGLTAAQVAQLHGQGRTPTQIAGQLGLAKSTVSHHLNKLGLKVGRSTSDGGSSSRSSAAAGRERAVRPEDRPPAPARPRRGALSHPRRQDRDGDTRGPDDPRPRRDRRRAP
jgi:hypothetical protein